MIIVNPRGGGKSNPKDLNVNNISEMYEKKLNGHETFNPYF